MVARTPSRLPRTSLFQNRNSKIEALCNRPQLNGDLVSRPLEIHCAARRRLQQLEVFHGKRNRRRNRLSAPASQIYSRRSAGYEYDSRELFLVCLIDAQPSRDSDHLPIWPTHCHAPHPEAPPPTSPREERGEVKKLIPLAPSSPSPARCREIPSPPARARRCRDDRAARL